MGAIGLVPAELGGIVVESAIYGMFLIMFIACLYCLLSKRRAQGGFSPGPVNRILLAAALILFISITTHWILDITRLYQAFVTENPDPLAYYANLSLPINVVKTGLYVFECIIADLIMCYRLWILWGRKTSICIFPLCTTLAFLVTGTGITYQFSKLKPGEDVFLSVCSRWITSAFTCTLVTNIYCTSIISYKIWKVDRAMKGFGQSSASVRIIGLIQNLVICESAALYTSCSIATLTAYLVNSNFQFPGLDSTSPVVGFVFCLIIVRVSLGLEHKGIISPPPKSSHSWSQGRATNPSVQLGTVDEEYSMNRVNISISHHVETDMDDNSLEVREAKYIAP